MGQYEDFKRNLMVNFAIELKDSNELIGSIGLDLELGHERGQLGFWIGVPYWNKGYCTEAAREIISYGFNDLKLNRIYASYFSSNPASGHVLKKIGMCHEGTQKQHYLRFGRFMDGEMCSILRSNFEQQ